MVFYRVGAADAETHVPPNTHTLPRVFRAGPVAFGEPEQAEKPPNLPFDAAETVFPLGYTEAVRFRHDRAGRQAAPICPRRTHTKTDMGLFLLCCSRTGGNSRASPKETCGVVSGAK